ncbi:thermonuclease family protein [Bradyrhizobium vignae]|uniref:Thermonuclease family protein n=1 Tax=Bradyrhizobium vignae TaxID=1549949 RepID=A0ABS4A759_9BRAD|nr:thermonuclease family protein [Bradyrhizobium vignae]MBP0116261.1 thermonuclease family protein [Bradyrhizobium vignae]
MVATLTGLATLFYSACAASDFAGRASVIDGDTLEIHSARIRLWGIDAPEHDQLCRDENSLQYRCGAKAANELDQFIGSRNVTCSAIDTDRYGRVVASCSVEGADLAEWLVSHGHALDWPRFSKGKYDQAQKDAERTGRGIWAGSFAAPWLYRTCIRAGGATMKCSDDAR